MERKRGSPFPRWMQHRREQERTDANVCLRRYVAACGGVGKKYVCVKSVQCCSAARETTDANSFSLSVSTTLHSCSISRSLVRSFCSSPSLTAASTPTHTHTHCFLRSLMQEAESMPGSPALLWPRESVYKPHTHGKA